MEADRTVLERQLRRRGGANLWELILTDVPHILY